MKKNSNLFRRGLALALIAAMVLLCCACGNTAAETASESPAESTAVPTAEVQPESTEAPAEEAPAESSETAETGTPSPTIPYQFLTKEECAETLGSLTNYYDSISQKCLDYFLQKKGGTIDEYIEWSRAQALDYTEEERSAIEESVQFIEERLAEEGMYLPPNVSVSFALTTMQEASGAGGYTHNTTVFLGKDTVDQCMESGDAGLTLLHTVVAHELFHCLTRNNPEFREAMYGIISFTVNDSDFVIPEDVHSLMISNPDVNHHDSYAAFTINGEAKDCYLVFLTDDTFENPGDSFFTGMYTGLVDISDGTLYRSDEASDFTDVMGENTDYCEDPEECMAVNFSYAVVYGVNGPEGGYKTPSIIETIISLCRQGWD